QRDALSRRERSQGRVETGSADDCVQHDVHIRPLRRFDETLRTATPLAVRHPVVHETNERRRKLFDLCLEQRSVVIRRERRHPKSILLAGEHTQRRRADRARRSEYRDAAPQVPLHQGAQISRNPRATYEIGSTNSKLSIRSSTPPWPGINRELSFTPASRLNNDSAR